MKYKDRHTLINRMKADNKSEEYNQFSGDRREKRKDKVRLRKFQYRINDKNWWKCLSHDEQVQIERSYYATHEYVKITKEVKSLEDITFESMPHYKIVLKCNYLHSSFLQLQNQIDMIVPKDDIDIYNWEMTWEKSIKNILPKDKSIMRDSKLSRILKYQ